MYREFDRARELDQFYTRTDIAKFCIDRLRRFVERKSPQADYMWLEPSAGDGAFLDLLPYPRLAFDIAPMRPDITTVDFLTWTPGRFTRPVIAVGNPPFGKNASLAQRFFNKAAQFADIVAFIVPRTFQKTSMINRLDCMMHLREEHELTLDSFRFGGQPYEVPTVFQVWQRGQEARTLTSGRLAHPDFAFGGADRAHFAFQRVGARAGLVSREGLGKSPQSHYFIEARIQPDELFERLRAIDWTGVKLRTAGNPSISKRELISCYEAAHGCPQTSFTEKRSRI